MNEVFDMFAGYAGKIRKLNKKTYKLNFETFVDTYGEYFRGLLDQINTVDDKASMATIEGQNFAKEAFEALAVKGKIKKMQKLDISIYVIYYIFPAILESKHENAELLCDKIRDEWNAKFEQNINYADYETIRDGFRDKLFGLF